MTEPAITIEDVSKIFKITHGGASSLKEIIISRNRSTTEEFWALRDINAELTTGQTVGLIGPNGSGKTTLLKCIAGILSPTSGRIRLNGRIASLLELGAGFHPDLTGRENVYLNASILGLSRKEVDKIFDDIVEFAELERFIDNQVKFYSSGMYVRLGFAVAINVDPSILLVDEVLAVGDELFQAKCLERVRQFQREGRTIVFVSHSADQVRKLCKTAMYLRDGEMHFHGPAADAVRAMRQDTYGSMSASSEGGQKSIGTGEVRIRNVTVASAGQQVKTIEPGNPLDVAVEIEPVEAVARTIVGVALYDEIDTHVWGTNTQIEGVNLPSPLAGPTTVRFRIPSLPLQEGKFMITVGVHSDADDVYAWQDRAYSFEVVNTTPFAGQVFIPHSVTASLADGDRSGPHLVDSDSDSREHGAADGGG